MGVSPRNLWDMKKFYERFCHSDIKVRQAVALLPWGHILRLLQRVGDDDAAMLFYAKETRSKGWNRDLLLNAIKLKMYETQALARVDNNFDPRIQQASAKLRNVFVKALLWCWEIQFLSWALINFCRKLCYFLLTEVWKRSRLRNVLPNESVCILNSPLLPWGIRISKIHWYPP